MALEQPHRTLGKVTTVFATKLKSFTFVPFLKRLPAENRVWKKVFQTNRAKSSGEPGDREKSMAEEGVYKAEVIYVQDPEDGQLGETHKSTTQTEIQSTDNLTLKPPTSLVGPPTEFSAVSPEPGPAVMETTENKHPSIFQLGFHNVSEAAEVSSGLFLNSSSQRQEALSPAGSVDFFNSPMSSKESILSEGWDKERSWSGLHMFSQDGSPGLSRTVSPCSSIRSGTFTPSVMRIKRHSLAPGSSLLHMSSTCGTPCCDSRATSPCPLSPRGRHRLPPTQLSLLTAILRKGRLPVLSSSSQRPYTPCWPISPVNVSSCLACSAASSVAPMNMPKAKSCTGIDRSCGEPCHNSELQKQDQSSLLVSSKVKTTDETIPTKSSERLDSCQPFPSSSRVESHTNHTPYPRLPPVQTAHSHLSKLSHKGNRLPVVPSSLLSGSHMSRSSPKSSTLFYSGTENQKNQLGSGDCPATVDTNKSAESLASVRHVETKTRSDNYSIDLKQSQQSSCEPYSQLKESSADYLAPYSAPNSCKSPSFYHTFESHSDSENQKNQLASRERSAIMDTNKLAESSASSTHVETNPHERSDIKYSVELKQSQNSSNEAYSKLKERSADNLTPDSTQNSCKSPLFHHIFESHSDSENQNNQLAPRGCPAIKDTSKLPESIASLTYVESKPRSDKFSIELKSSQKPNNEPCLKVKESSADHFAPNSAQNSCKSPSFYHLFESHSDSENQKNQLASREHPAIMDPNKLPESLASVKHVETKPRLEEYSVELKQSQKSSYSKHNKSSDNPAPNPARHSCKSPSTLESHSNPTCPDLTIKGNKIKNDLERVLLSSPALRLSPSPKPMGLSGLSYTPPVSPALPTVQPKSRSSTPDRGTLSPSPGRQLSPSPSYSCSSPSPSLWGSSQDCADGDCKNRKTYKIKSTYKALAAIPTNTLLLEQQAIDEEVSRKEALLNPADNYSWEDPHAEMCSPAQLRQQTAELYATIDEVLEDTIQRRQSNHVNKAIVKSLAAEASRQQTSSPSPKLLGRETRYTKPGVIRPVIITSRFTEDQDEEFHPNPFKILQGNKSNRYQYKFVSGGLCAESPADAPADSDPQPSERQEDYKSQLVSTQDVPSAVNTHETHI
ncbi:muscular LMNA-interacting protein isoform X2 [Danio aesculapii]|uniref:muscular LMNA-interacting protein isoform X2 n=1 Tax=Danio aesculapii TaxID=1142201 RepID=UPI0024BF1B90|nr:muscular LMNA-interacting protein isoform X2 [Danio aesculapii]